MSSPCVHRRSSSSPTSDIALSIAVIGTQKPRTIIARGIFPAQLLWSGAGPNRRPSAFQTGRSPRFPRPPCRLCGDLQKYGWGNTANNGDGCGYGRKPPRRSAGSAYGVWTSSVQPPSCRFGHDGDSTSQRGRLPCLDHTAVGTLTACLRRGRKPRRISVAGGGDSHSETPGRPPEQGWPLFQTRRLEKSLVPLIPVRGTAAPGTARSVAPHLRRYRPA